ncbi:hypothetical protein HDU76_013964 [Blyttiomyces sp. JEL0837]|nr:hypothetical protein HDU76_013964 [Blyttiomyces sp. JEL0837]
MASDVSSNNNNTGVDIAITPRYGDLSTSFIFESKNAEDLRIRGTVHITNLTQQFINEAIIVLGLRGSAQVLWRDQVEDLHQFQHKVLSSNLILYDSTERGPLPPGDLSLEFEFNLGRTPLPPTFVSEGITVSYSLKSEVTFKNRGWLMSRRREAEVPVVILFSSRRRGLMMALQSPLLVQSPGWKDQDGYLTVLQDATSGTSSSGELEYEVFLRRRVLLKGDTLPVDITVRTQPTVRSLRVTAELRSELQFYPRNIDDTTSGKVLNFPPTILAKGRANITIPSNNIANQPTSDIRSPPLSPRLGMTPSTPLFTASSFILSANPGDLPPLPPSEFSSSSSSPDSPVAGSMSKLIISAGNIVENTTNTNVVQHTVKMALKVPITSPQSLDYSLFSHKVCLRISFLAETSNPAVKVDSPVTSPKHPRFAAAAASFGRLISPNPSPSQDSNNTPIPLAIVEVPIVILAPGTSNQAGVVPILPRGDSLDRKSEFEWLENEHGDGKRGRGQHRFIENSSLYFKVVRGYVPDQTRDDEIPLAEGDRVKVVDIFEDGWALAKNITQNRVGVIPLHHVEEESFSGRKDRAKKTVPQPAPPALLLPEDNINQPSQDRRSRARSPSFGTIDTNRTRDASPSGRGGNKAASMLSSTMFSSTSGTSGNTPTVVVDEVVSAAMGEAYVSLLRRVADLMSTDKDVDDAFLCLAEQRYLKFLRVLRDTLPVPEAVPIPPIDVALVWHAHLLHPLNYLQDCFYFFHNQSANPYSLPLLRMQKLSWEYKPESGGSVAIWEAFTGTPCTMSIPDSIHAKLEAVCPGGCCDWVGVLEATVYVKYRIRGEAIVCPGCKGSFSKEEASVKRFLDAVVGFRDGGEKKNSLRGTLLSSTHEIDPAKALLETSILTTKTEPLSQLLALADSKAFKKNPLKWPQLLKLFNRHIAALLRGAVLDKVNGRPVSVDVTKLRKTTPAKIVRAYRNLAIPALSVDLCAAVRRQRVFAWNVVGSSGGNGSGDNGDAASADSGYPVDDIWLGKAAMRYERFWKLLQKEGGKVLAPTIDLDLFWHIHQLHPYRYQKYSLAMTGTIIDHDDDDETVSLGRLYEVFTTTQRVWRRWFMEPYVDDSGDGSTGNNNSKSMFGLRRKVDAVGPGSRLVTDVIPLVKVPNNNRNRPTPVDAVETYLPKSSSLSSSSDDLEDFIGVDREVATLTPPRLDDDNGDDEDVPVAGDKHGGGSAGTIGRTNSLRIGISGDTLNGFRYGVKSKTSMSVLPKFGSGQ